MKKYILFIVCVILPVVLSSCDGQFLANGYLDKTPDQDLTLEDVFTNRKYTESFLTSIYAALPWEINPPDPPSRAPWTGISDEMEITFGGFPGHKINHGAWGPSDIPDLWQYSYESIRKSNIFLDNIDQLPLTQEFTQANKNTWIGEATFLRAYYHFSVFRLYGSIPIMDYAVSPNDDFTKINRAPLDSVVAFMIQDCDRAAQLLPMNVTSSNRGRASQAAALALKSRILLYAASPLFNGNASYANFTDHEGIHLFPQSGDNEKWKLAADAAKNVIDQAEAAGYDLYKSASNDPMQSYQNLFIENWNEEVLWATNHGHYGHQERTQSPLGYGGFSIMSVTQELVDAYQMADGTDPIVGYENNGSPKINAISGYQETGYTNSAGTYWNTGIRNMYVNREPRFYASVHFAGSEWKERPVEMWYTGLDGHIQNPSDFSKTGYVMKKFANPDINIKQNTGWDLKTWILFRLGEQYLNYAEALNEYEGPVADVYKYVNAIRDRAGLPDLPSGLSKDEMREKIWHERRIELAFEGHRYFDVRRWTIAEEILDGPVHGMNIRMGNSLQDDSFYERTIADQRIFEPKHYLWPIPQEEIEKVPSLVQNPGW